MAGTELARFCAAAQRASLYSGRRGARVAWRTRHRRRRGVVPAVVALARLEAPSAFPVLPTQLRRARDDGAIGEFAWILSNRDV